jgi:hypothetical protein
MQIEIVHKLLITYDTQSGVINVEGPILNRAICYLMLEMARDAVHDYKGAAAPPTDFDTHVKASNGTQRDPALRRHRRKLS